MRMRLELSDESCFGFTPLLQAIARRRDMKEHRGRRVFDPDDRRIAGASHLQPDPLDCRRRHHLINVN